MLDLYTQILSNPHQYKQLTCNDNLISVFNCPLDNNRQDMWAEYNYFVYVLQGRKIWHTTDGAYDLRKGSCVLVRKGACIIEQFLDASSCFVIFFVTDEFICDVLQSKTSPVSAPPGRCKSVINVQAGPTLKTFFQSMLPFFKASRTPDKSLISLKFRELILTIADDSQNAEILSYFCSLLNAPRAVSLQGIMEDNFCYNLKMEEFARLSSRSLSAFKRDFIRIYQTTPGKWLLEKRLDHALHLIRNRNMTVNEVVFECGFENPSHFSRAFRARFGKSPASFKHGFKTKEPLAV